MKVQLLEDYGGKEKGNSVDLPQSLATSLIRKGKAKVYVEKVKEPKKPKEEK